MTQIFDKRELESHILTAVHTDTWDVETMSKLRTEYDC